MQLPEYWSGIPKPVQDEFRLSDFLEKYWPGQNPVRVPAEIQRLLSWLWWTALRGKKILDIWGWSSENHDAKYCYPEWSENDNFEPWYSRVAYNAWAEVTCIDIWDNSGERFASEKINLCVPNILIEKFWRAVFEMINNYKFSLPPKSKHWQVAGNSPLLITEIAENMTWASFWSLLRLLINKNKPILDFDAKITRQVNHMLCEWGTYTHAEFVFQKQHWKLVHVHTIEWLWS